MVILGFLVPDLINGSTAKASSVSPLALRSRKLRRKKASYYSRRRSHSLDKGSLTPALSVSHSYSTPPVILQWSAMMF